MARTGSQPYELPEIDVLANMLRYVLHEVRNRMSPRAETINLGMHNFINELPYPGHDLNSTIILHFLKELRLMRAVTGIKGRWYVTPGGRVDIGKLQLLISNGRVPYIYDPEIARAGKSAQAAPEARFETVVDDRRVEQLMGANNRLEGEVFKLRARVKQLMDENTELREALDAITSTAGKSQTDGR